METIDSIKKIKAPKKSIEIKEIPINYEGRTYDQGKKITAIDGLKAIRTIIKYKYFRVSVKSN